MPRNSVPRWRPPSPSPDSARYRRRPNPVSLSDMEAGYSTALLDWLGCATPGLDEPPALAARAAGDPVLALGAAGHVLDFDDTYLPGLAHLSAPTAPVALLLGAERAASGGGVRGASPAGLGGGAP